MKTIKGPGLFLAQLIGTSAPFDSFDAITAWAADCGYLGVQIPSGADALIDLGVDAKRIEVQGFGESFPVAENASAKGRAQNRRVEILFSDEQGRLGAKR